MKFYRWLFDGLDVGARASSGEITNFGHSEAPSIVVRAPKITKFFRIALVPNRQVGETFVKGDWEIVSGDLTDFLKQLLVYRGRSKLAIAVDIVNSIRTPIYLLRQYFNLSWSNPVQRHYDDKIGFFKKMIGEDLIYTCVIFKDPEDTLEVAQERKFGATAA